jgi:hypothetical protein
MCWHKWEKWSDIHSERWSYTPLMGYGEKTYFEKQFQQRTCSKCGKIQKKYIPE